MREYLSRRYAILDGVGRSLLKFFLYSIGGILLLNLFTFVSMNILVGLIETALVLTLVIVWRAFNGRK